MYRASADAVEGNRLLHDPGDEDHATLRGGPMMLAIDALIQ